MVHWDSPHLTIHWDPDASCVHLEWKGFVHGEKGRTGLNMGLDFFKTKSTNRWLADTRQLRVVPEEDLKWINEDWFPRAIAAGVRRMALVVPESVLAKRSRSESPSTSASARPAMFARAGMPALASTKLEAPALPR